MKHFSKLGVILVGVYAVITGIVFIFAFTCEGEMFCGLIALAPVMPWPLVMEILPRSLMNLINNTIGLFIFAFLNAVIIYFSGLLIENLINKMRKKQ